MEYKIVSTIEKSNGKIERTYQEQYPGVYVTGINVENPTNPKVKMILENSERLLNSLGLKRLEVVAELES